MDHPNIQVFITRIGLILGFCILLIFLGRYSKIIYDGIENVLSGTMILIVGLNYKVMKMVKEEE